MLLDLPGYVEALFRLPCKMSRGSDIVEGDDPKNNTMSKVTTGFK
jgi:hypothetical protein